MKKITKLFISLSAILAISYSATTTATQINVTTRNPRGSLRLNQLYMKNGNTTGIHLDGTHQTLKVGHANQSGVTLSGASKVLTNQICDANGKNCKNVSQLSTGNTTYTAGNGIKIENYKISSTVIDTNTHNTAYIYAGKSNGSRNETTTNGNTYLILKDGNSVSNRVKITGTNGVSVSSDNNGTITISGSTNSNTNKTLTIKGGGTSVTKFDGSLDRTLNIVAGNNITITPEEGQIKISASTNTTSSDSLRKTGYFTIGLTKINYLTPKNDINTLYLSGNSSTIYFGKQLGAASLKFQRYGLQAATSPVEFTHMGAKFGADVREALTSTVGGVSINGELLVGNNGNTGNYIRIYSSGTIGGPNANNRHYEIMATKELAVGTYDGAYLYFKNYNSTNSTYTKHRIGVNTQDPQATLDIKGSIRLQDDKCSPFKCKQESAGSIKFFENKFYGCKKVEGSNNYRWHEFTMNSYTGDNLGNEIVCQQTYLD